MKKLSRVIEDLAFAINLPMISQVILPPERFTADIARIRPLISMRPLVYQQIITLGELPVAKFANELLLGPGAPRHELLGHRRPHHLQLRSRVVESRPRQPLVHEVGVRGWGGEVSGGVVMIGRFHGGFVVAVPGFAGVPRGGRWTRRIRGRVRWGQQR